MDEKDLLKKIEQAKLNDITMDKNRDFLKNILMRRVGGKKEQFFVFKPLSIALAAFAFVMSAVIVVIEDSNKPDPVNNMGGIWSTYDDHYLGGNSTVWPPASTTCENLFVKSKPGYDNKGYAIRVTGTAGTDTREGGAFFGVNTFLSQRAACPRCEGIDISKFTGIRFKMKGSINGGRLVFIIPYQSREIDSARGICKTLTNYADYEADITQKATNDWKTVSINFRRDLKQPAGTKPEETVGIEKVLSDANVIKWHYRNGNGQRVDIWLAKLEFY